MAILTTHKQTIQYLEHCRLVVNDEKLTLIRRKDALEKFWSIPYGNLAVLLLGPGTSLTQQAARLLASENVMVSFTGGGGTPIFLATQNEYRPTEYLQSWMRMWLDEGKRLQVGKFFQEQRAYKVFQAWLQMDKQFDKCESITARYLEDVKLATNNALLMAYEAKFTKQLYAFLVKRYDCKNFCRDRTAEDDFNQFLNNGNYLAYGLGAATLWSLGLSFSLPVSHGKTRRGGLVFDIADLIKDACIMPIAFQQAAGLKNSSEFRKACIDWLDKQQALRFLFDTVVKAVDTLC
jgi:CRISPR-associated protein Cas1